MPGRDYKPGLDHVNLVLPRAEFVCCPVDFHTWLDDVIGSSVEIIDADDLTSDEGVLYLFFMKKERASVMSCPPPETPQ